MNLSNVEMDALHEMLRMADLKDDAVQHIELAGLSTNAVYYITLMSGSQLVLRIYGDCGWPGDYDRARLKKELYLHELLARRGVLVPKIIASVDTDDVQAVLMLRLAGQPLGAALSGVDEPEQKKIWSAVGVSMRAIHAIALADGAGEIKGDRVVPFGDGAASAPPKGWGAFAMHDFVEDVEQLSDFVPALRVDRGLLEGVVLETRRRLDVSPAQLLHNDPTVENIFVQQVDGDWRCCGWLDWEFARHGDPAWDCARLELFRDFTAPAPSIEFWNSYGLLNEVNLCANRLLVALFCARVQHDNKQIHPQRHKHAMDWLVDFPEAIAHLDRLLQK